MSHPKIWSIAPTIGWPTYLLRKIVGAPTSPTIIYDPINVPPTPIQSTSSYSVNPMDPGKAKHYSEFLEKHFYPKELGITLRVPESLLYEKLKSREWIGVEIRSKSINCIIGCAINKAAGYIGKDPCGIVDYLCVDPSWRKMGIADILLYTLYAYAVEYEGRAGIFFKKEGGFKLAPPISYELYIGRRTIERNNRAPAEVTVQKLDRFHWNNLLEAHKENGSDIIALAKHNINHETELQVASYNALHVIYKPTWEFSKDEAKGKAIVIAWYCGETAIRIHKGPQDNDIGQDYETIVNHIPYDFIYAPSSFPHITKVESTKWSVQGMMGVYCANIDPGIPFSRTLLSYNTA